MMEVSLRPGLASVVLLSVFALISSVYLSMTNVLNPENIPPFLLHDEQQSVSVLVAALDATATTATTTSIGNGSPTNTNTNTNNSSENMMTTRGGGGIQQYNEEDLVRAWNRLSWNVTQQEEQSNSSIMLLNVIQRNYTPKLNPSKNDITAAVHLSVGKFDRFLLLSRRWNGPISVSIYIRNVTDIHTFVTLLQMYQTELYQCSFHILMEKTDLKYPHNTLRQMAIDTIESELVLILDVDFVTQPNAHYQLVHQLLLFTPSSEEEDMTSLRTKEEQELLLNHCQTLLVLPAFELESIHVRNNKNLSNLGNETLPSTREEAILMIKMKKLHPFHMKFFRDGHGPTNYRKWIDGSSSSSSRTSTNKHKHNNKHNDTVTMIPNADVTSSSSSSYYYPIEYGYRFEPYVIGYKECIPKFWTGFRGYGINKWSFFLEAHKMGFEFVVLRDFFVIHLDHGIYKGRLTPQSTRKEFQKFQQYLRRTYPSTTTARKTNHHQQHHQQKTASLVPQTTNPPPTTTATDKKKKETKTKIGKTKKKMIKGKKKGKDNK